MGERPELQERRRSLLEHADVLPEVAGNSTDNTFKEAGELVAIRSADGSLHRLRRPYWLYVGGADFRKNIAGLIEGFALARASLADVEPTLVIACKLSAAQIKSALELGGARGLKPGIDLVLTGFVSDETLEICYRGAFSVVFPSLYEGLGLPVLEGYHFGVPAIVSRNSSLRELAPTCCQFDVGSREEMADLMVLMHRDPSLREKSLSFAGEKMLTLFNWQAAAMRVAAYLRGSGDRSV